MDKKSTSWVRCLLSLSLSIISAACDYSGKNTSSDEDLVMQTFPADSIAGLVKDTQIFFDPEISSDGAGSLRIEALHAGSIPLYESGDIDIEQAQLIYRAKIRTKDVSGPVYLEMLAVFNQRGEFFSRALHAPVTGTTDWVEQETPFFLNADDNPDNIKMNIVINGTGTVWVDDIQLIRRPMPGS